MPVTLAAETLSSHHGRYLRAFCQRRANLARWRTLPAVRAAKSWRQQAMLLPLAGEEEDEMEAACPRTALC